MIEIIIVGVILLFIVSYRYSAGEGVYKFITEQASNVYDKYAPYSYKEIRERIKKLGLQIWQKAQLLYICI